LAAGEHHERAILQHPVHQDLCVLHALALLNVMTKILAISPSLIFVDFPDWD
jgi:hypothetical protein